MAEYLSEVLRPIGNVPRGLGERTNYYRLVRVHDHDGAGWDGERS